MMLGLIILCIIILSSSYYCLKASGQSLGVHPFENFDDYFNDKK
ncbi:hypothetical protein PZE06_07815 [Robertmurraya sp. DFI.2.37]|nr:hypothetical protein [Robertmurraya sp. DFI.2.37]MDF1508089.1 hypothetical protein [Robertmurraya sp. DFI.2.37]